MGKGKLENCAVGRISTVPKRDGGYPTTRRPPCHADERAPSDRGHLPQLIVRFLSFFRRGNKHDVCAGDPQGEATKTAGLHRVRGPGDVPKRQGAHRPEDGGRLVREGLRGLHRGFGRDPRCLTRCFLKRRTEAAGGGTERGQSCSWQMPPFRADRVASLSVSYAIAGEPPNPKLGKGAPVRTTHRRSP